LSERDLRVFEKQLQDAASDVELAKLQPIGWFLAHTRGPLILTEQEKSLFARYFPEPRKLTVLVKPERFQATRFVFLVRQPDKEMPQAAASSAVILPLRGRAQQSGQITPGRLIPSLTAPAPVLPKLPERAIRPLARGAEGAITEQKVQNLVDTPPAELGVLTAPVTASRPVGETVPELASQSEVVSGMEPADGSETAVEQARAARKHFSRHRTRVMEKAFPPHSQSALRPPSFPPPQQNSANSLPTAYDRYQDLALEAQPEKRFSLPALTTLALAALLGCVVGYVAYLQLPSPVIPLEVHSADQIIVISWPAQDTRSAIYAAIRLNDGPPVPLSAKEKTTGQVSLSATSDFKVEVLARNWIRDSRGIVRYLHSPGALAPAAPSEVR
jgi:hypothetical protein